MANLIEDDDEVIIPSKPKNIIEDETPPGYETTQEGLQPKGLVKPTTMSQFGDSVTEDVRRVGEFVSSTPDKVKGLAARAVTDIAGFNPARAAQRAAGQAMNNQPITNPMTAEMEAQGFTKPTAGEQVFPDPGMEVFSSPISALGKKAVNAVSEANPLDVDVGNDASLRQLVNYSAHRSTGRVLNWLQEVAGKPIAQMMLSGSRSVGELAHEVADVPYDKPLVELNADTQMFQMGGSMAGQTMPIIKGIDENPELHEHVSRTFLETLGGPSIMLPPERQETARQQMTREYGDTGAKVVEVGAQFIGTWPVMLLPGVGQMHRAVALEEAATLGKAAEGSPTFIRGVMGTLPKQLINQSIKVQAAEGALQSYYLASARKGSDVGLEVGLGTLAGGLLGVGAGMYQARKLPGVLAKAINPGVVVPPSTMAQLAMELDQTFARIQPKVRRVSGSTEPISGMRLQQAKGHQPSLKQAKQAEGALAVDTLRQGNDAPEMDFDLIEGEVAHPSFSKFTFNVEGNYVLRDYEVIAGAGRATKGPGGKTAHSTNVTAKYRDTKVTDANGVYRLMGRNGSNLALSAMTDEELAAMDQLLRTSDVINAKPNIEGGTYDYMAPEQAAKMGEIYAMQGGKGLTPQRRLDLLNELRAAKNKRPMVMTLGNNGRLEFTEVPAATPRSVESAVKVGDDVLVHGQVPGKVVARGPEGLTVEIPGGVKPITVSVADTVVNPYTQSMDHYTGTPEQRSKLEAYQKWKAYELDKPRGQRNLSDATATPSGAEVSPRTKAIIKASVDITPQDVLRWEGRNPNDLGWAVASLRKLEQEGVLEHIAGGKFVPRDRNPTLPRDASMDGEFVYIGTGGPSSGDYTGMGQVGVLRGKDPRTPNNYLVEVPEVHGGIDAKGNYLKSKMVSVTEAEVRTMKPVSMADKSKVNPDIDMYGWTKPMPPQFIQASQGALTDIEEMTKFWSKVAPPSLTGKTQHAYNTLKETMGGAMHTANYNVRMSKAQKIFSAAQTMKSEAMATSDMLAQKLGGLGSPANMELTRVLEAAASRTPNGVAVGVDPAKLALWAKKYPKEAQAALSDIKALIAQRDTQSMLLVKYGIPQVMAAEEARGELAAYLTRNYAAFSMPREDWAKFARKNLTTEWHDLMEYMASQRPDIQASQHSGNIDEILRLNDPIKGFVEKGYIKAEGKGKLIEKIEVPKPIRAILGEFNDASTRLAFTVAWQRQLLKGIEGFNAIAQHPALWSPGWRPDMTLQVPPDPLFGAAQSGFVHDNPSMRLLIEGRKSSNIGDSVAFLQASGWLGQRWKAAHTVWNPVAWANNTLRGVKTMVLSGGFLGPEDFDAFREAAAMLKDYANDPTIYGRNKLLVEAMDFDAVGPGLAGAELGLAQKKFQRSIFDHYIKSQGKGSTMFDLYTGLRDMAMSVPESVHNGYDSIDKVVKLGCYLNLRRRFIAQGYSVHDAAALSSLRVNQSAQNFAQTPDWLKRTVGAGNFSLLAPFASSKLEDVRINASAVARVMKTLNPMSPPHEREYDLLARLAGFSALMGGMATVALNTRRMNGISDADDDMQRDSIPMRAKQYHPMLLGSLDYDERGRRVFYPFEQVEDLAMSFRGNVQDPALVNFLMNNLLEVVGHGTVVGGAVEGAAQATGLYHPRDPQQPPRPDQTGLMNTAAKVGAPFLPQGGVNLVNTMNPQRHGLIAPEELTPDQKLFRAAGGPQPIPVGPQTQAQSNMENVSTALDAKSDINAAARQGALQGASSDRLKYMIQSNVNEMKKKLRPVPRSLKEPK